MSELKELIKSFEVSISKEDLEQTFKILDTMVENINLNLDIEGMYFKTMDAQHVALIDIAIPNSNFQKYDVSDGIFFGVNINNILKIIKEFNKNDMITMTVKHNDKNEQVLKLSNHELSYTVLIDEAYSNDVPLPKIPYDSLITLDNVNLKRYLSKVNVISEHVKIETTSNNCILSGINDKGECKIKLEKGMNQLIDLIVKNESESNFSLEFLLAYLKAMTKNYNHNIEFSTSKPLRIDSKIFNVGRCHFYLAPRVEN